MRCLLFASLCVSIASVGSAQETKKEPPKDPFAQWDKSIAAFEKQDEAKPPPKNAILFAGSSSIVRWKLSDWFKDMDVINRGFGGSRIADSVHFATRIITKHQPRIVVFYAGDNDIASGLTPEKVAADFQALSEIIHKESPKTQIIFVSIKPSPSRWKHREKQNQANALIEAFCKKDERRRYLDVGKAMLGEDGMPRDELFVADKLHMSDAGYRVWTSLLTPMLK